MKVIRGKVVKCVSERSQWMKKLETYYSSKTGIKLFPGTLHIQLLESYLEVQAQYNKGVFYENESSNMCFVNGKKVCYLDMNVAESVCRESNHTIIEIITDLELIESLKLGEGDEVEVLIPASREALLH